MHSSKDPSPISLDWREEEHYLHRLRLLSNNEMQQVISAKGLRVSYGGDLPLLADKLQHVELAPSVHFDPSSLVGGTIPVPDPRLASSKYTAYRYDDATPLYGLELDESIFSLRITQPRRVELLQAMWNEFERMAGVAASSAPTATTAGAKAKDSPTKSKEKKSGMHESDKRVIGSGHEGTLIVIMSATEDELAQVYELATRVADTLCESLELGPPIGICGTFLDTYGITDSGLGFCQMLPFTPAAVLLMCQEGWDHHTHVGQIITSSYLNSGVPVFVAHLFSSSLVVSRIGFKPRKPGQPIHGSEVAGPFGSRTDPLHSIRVRRMRVANVVPKVMLFHHTQTEAAELLSWMVAAVATRNTPVAAFSAATASAAAAAAAATTTTSTSSSSSAAAAAAAATTTTTTSSSSAAAAKLATSTISEESKSKSSGERVKLAEEFNTACEKLELLAREHLAIWSELLPWIQDFRASISEAGVSSVNRAIQGIERIGRVYKEGNPLRLRSALESIENGFGPDFPEVVCVLGDMMVVEEDEEEKGKEKGEEKEKVKEKEKEEVEKEKEKVEKEKEKEVKVATQRPY